MNLSIYLEEFNLAEGWRMMFQFIPFYRLISYYIHVWQREDWTILSSKAKWFKALFFLTKIRKNSLDSRRYFCRKMRLFSQIFINYSCALAIKVQLMRTSFWYCLRKCWARKPQEIVLHARFHRRNAWLNGEERSVSELRESTKE